MKSPLLCFLVVSSLAIFIGSAQTAEPAGSGPAATEIEALIDQLGDDSFQARETAMAKLIQVGPPAEPSIQAALDAPDPEVAYRAKKILKEIDRNLIQKRRDAFLAGDIDQLKTNAASWKHMEKLVGNTREARELFAQMQESGVKLLTTVEEDPKRFSQEVVQLYTLDQQMRRFGGGNGLPAGVVAAMVLLGSDEKVSLDATAVSRCTSLLYRHRASFGRHCQWL